MSDSIQKTLNLTDEECVEGYVDGLKQLGAVYKSHNKDNIYIAVRKGSLLDNDEYIKKAKKSAQLYAKRVLKIEMV